jgi:hypothetical protein
MIPVFLLKFVAGIVGPKFAKPAIFVVLGLLILGALWGGKCAYDNKIINAHEAKQDAANAKADRKADASAAEQRRVDDTRLTNETTELNRSTEHAQTDLDRRLGFQRCLRLQQRARAAKLVVPTCG